MYTTRDPRIIREDDKLATSQIACAAHL